MTEQKVAVVDGANVAFIEVSSDGKPKVSYLVAVRRALKRRGYKPIIVVDASLRHQVDDPQQLESLIDDQVIRQAPAGTDADYFILEIAEDEQGLVISNDEFEKSKDRYPWIEERRVPLMIVNGQVELYERQLE
jgi:hypothetical protein